MEAVLYSAPSVYPVSVADIKTHLRIDATDTTHDDYIESLMVAIVDRVESFLGRKLITQTWDLKFSSWQDLIEDDNELPRVLPFGQTQSITSIVYKDEDGNNQTISTDYYTLTLAGTDAARIVFNYDDDLDDFDWPDLWSVDQITVRLVCGYGATGAAVPAPIKTAILLMVGDLFNDEDSSFAIEHLLNSYRLWRC